MPRPHQPIDGKFLSLLRKLLRRVAALERNEFPSRTYYGPRSDAPFNGDNGPRVRIGRLSDGSYGVERWTEAGTRQTPTWS